MRPWDRDPVVITCAITGADVFRDTNPNVPYTTAEIADSAIGAAQAGATIAHLHVREDDGTPSGRPELFTEVIERIRAGAPELLTMVSTGGANDHTIEQRTGGLEAAPDISGVESGSMNFGDETFITPPPAGRGIVQRATVTDTDGNTLTAASLARPPTTPPPQVPPCTGPLGERADWWWYDPYDPTRSPSAN